MSEIKCEDYDKSKLMLGYKPDICSLVEVKSILTNGYVNAEIHDLIDYDGRSDADVSIFCCVCGIDTKEFPDV